MPSLRTGFNCSDCPLRGYEMPYSNEESERIIHASALAVAYAAGYEGEVSGDSVLDNKAVACAKRISSNSCPMWVRTDKNGGFVHRDGRHKPLQVQPKDDTVTIL